MNDIRIVQGETIDIMVTVKDENGQIVTLDGFEGIFGSSITGQKKMTVADNMLILSLTSLETLKMQPKEYRYEIKVKTADEKIKSILSGHLIITKAYVQFGNEG